MIDSSRNPGSITRLRGDPREACSRWLADEATAAPALLLVSFELEQYWLTDKSALSLTALYLLAEEGLQVAVTDARLDGDGTDPRALYRQLCEEHGLVSATDSTPLILKPTAIPKPWGQEIWYSGVEERGVCCFQQGLFSTPIPWLQAVMPGDVLGEAGVDLVLLKILDPAPQAVTGDLYFELHEEKREVYVVTHVDTTAWPDGTGAIRYGFSPQKIADAGSEANFRKHYLEAVTTYEAVRRRIDALPAGIDPPEELLIEESQLRDTMNDFTQLRPLRVGDVVVVPLLLPHSLQHGVRTIEFQTPVYERKILSFAQRVLTQDHWDTQEAVARMALLPPEAQEHERLVEEAGCVVERIVDFEDFEVWRVTLKEGAGFTPPAADHYRIVMAVTGRFAVAGVDCGPEQALILPAGTAPEIRPEEHDSAAVFLLASPRP